MDCTRSIYSKFTNVLRNYRKGKAKTKIHETNDIAMKTSLFYQGIGTSSESCPWLFSKTVSLSKKSYLKKASIKYFNKLLIKATK